MNSKINSTRLVELSQAITLLDASKILGVGRWYLARRDSRDRLGLQVVRVRTALDSRIVWLSKESVATAIASRGRSK